MKGGGNRHLSLLGNTIATEYDYSPSLINAYVESNHYSTNEWLNNAEINAMNAERERDEMKRKKQREYEENMTGYKKNNSEYRIKKEKGKSLDKIHQLENEKKKLNQMVYNATVRKSNLKKSVNQKIIAQNRQGKPIDYMKTQSKKEDDKFLKKSDNSDKENEVEADIVLKPKNTNEIEQLNKVDHHVESNSITIDIRSTLDDIINSKLQTQKNKAINCLLKEKEEEEKNAYQSISHNLKQLSQFRQKGTFNSNKTIQTSTKQTEQKESDRLSHRNHSTKSIPYSNNNNNSNLKPNQNHFLSKLDKKRFNLALQKIFIERLGERKIKIPCICNCGQLQKDLDTILYVKNNSVYSVFKPSCANNCLYYNKRNEYEKSINDILTSIRNLKFESFNNKY